MRRRVKLGQHFLNNREVLVKIIKCAAIKKGEKIIEVGPGKGVLTKELLKKGAEVIAVEIDSELVEILRKELGENKNLKIINEDILEISNPEKGRCPNGTYGLKSKISNEISNTKYKIIANLPYQITSPVIRKFLENKELRPKLMVLMVQREVAERICAKSGDSKRGFLSVLVQYYARPEIVRIVSRESFYPVPKVESAILKIEIPNPKSQIPNKSKIQNSKSAKRLFRLVQAGFSQKRKKLRNSLAGGLQVEPKKMDKILQKAGIDSNLRAEDLEVEKWLAIAAKTRSIFPA